MSQTPQPTNEPSILAKFASILTLLGAALYFTGWIYRWSYFSFFQLEVTTLDLPLESFLFVPIQVFMGTLWAFCKTVFVTAIAVSLILLTLRVIQKQKFIPISFKNSILDETIIVIWVLIALFWLARWQGEADAWRDAVNDTSNRPVVTFVAPIGKVGLGRNPDDLLAKPSLPEFRIIGDAGLLDSLRGRETNDTRNQAKPVVWRLLVKHNSQFYLFLALPPKADSKQRPPVLMIQESSNGDQLMILSPQVSK